jgi:ABC-2 type transport system ATP-binding protein
MDYISKLESVNKYFINDIDIARNHSVKNLFLRRYDYDDAHTSLCLKKINFTWNEGEKILVLSWPKSGKSSFVDVVSGIKSPDTGKARTKKHILVLRPKTFVKRPLLKLRDYIFSIIYFYSAEVKDYKSIFDNVLTSASCENLIDRRLENIDVSILKKVEEACFINLSTNAFIFDNWITQHFQDKVLNIWSSCLNLMVVQDKVPTNVRIFNRGIILKDGAIIFDGDVKSTIEIFTRYNSVYNISEKFKPKFELAKLIENPNSNQESSKQLIIHSRKGTGKLRIIDFSCYGQSDTSNQIFSGGPANFIFKVKSYSDLSRDGIFIVVSFASSNGQRIFGTPLRSPFESNRINSEEFSYKLHIPNLNLLPGDYQIVTSISQGSDLLDKITAGQTFKVEFSDFFKDGKLHQSNLGYCLLKYDWDIEI